MTVTCPYDLVIGLDRSDRKADLHFIDTRSGKQWSQTVETKPEALHDWLAELRQQFPQANVGLCVEQPAGAILPFLEGYAWITLHAINPLSLQKYREAFVAHPDRPCRSSRPPSTQRTPCPCEAGVGKDSRV